MQLLRKLIILSAIDNTGKGIIKLESIGTKVKGNITIFEPKGLKYRLGIRINYSRLYEYELTNQTLKFELEDNTDLTSRIESMVIDTDTMKPLLYGSSNGQHFDIDKLHSMFTSNIKANDNLNNKQQAYAQELKPNLDTNQQNNHSITGDDSKKVQDIKEKLEEDFFISIKPQLDELFKCYPADKELMRSVPDSKWVRVNYEKEEFYVVGVLYNGKRATHICYGVPGMYSVRPKQKSEWLPLDYLDPEGKGYWVIFQDAITGKTID